MAACFVSAHSIMDTPHFSADAVHGARNRNATHKDVTHLQSSQENADTKMLLHALRATADGSSEMQIQSPDIDVFVLTLRCYPDLCEKTSFFTGKGSSHRVIKL